MHGNVNFQIQSVFGSIKEIGQSRHIAKEEARANGAKNWHEVGKELGVHNFNTYDGYRDVSKQMYTWVREEHGLRDLTKIESYQIAAWLDHKMENGVNERASYDKYASALEKLEVAINQYNTDKGIASRFILDLKESRATAAHKLGKRSTDSRAYANPSGLVESVTGKYNLLANVIRESGARIDEAHHIREHQLRGVKPDPITGELKGWVEVKGKGGKIREIGMSLKTYDRLTKAIAAGGGLYHTNKGNYREALQKAAQKTDQRYEGPHGQRWSWAQARHDELQRRGMSYEASLTQISKEMGHARSDITCHYLH